MKRYAVKEAFASVQGEGYWAGSPCVFIRFAGCNIWSGVEAQRAEAARLRGCCARYCDTDFVGHDGLGGGLYTARELAELAAGLWRGDTEPMVVLTGGEPALQIDEQMLEVLHVIAGRIHCETNGSLPLPAGLDWVTVSPKPPSPVVLERADEVKVLYPLVDNPIQFEHLAKLRYVQPVDGLPVSAQVCIDFVLRYSGWRVSTQTHKILGVR